MQLKKALVFFAVFFLLILGRECRAETATAQLRASIDQILTVLRDPALKPEDLKQVRRERLRQIAAGRFDYRKMSEQSLGKYWNDRTPEEKEEFTRLFSKLLEETYVSKIEAYTDEKILFLNERVVKNRAQVDTKILTDTVEIPINYRMYQRDDGSWQVYDLIIEGVSLNNNYRSQFGQILDRHSFEELVDKLKEK